MTTLAQLQPKCIIFDCDGVLVDSEAISFSVLRELAAEMGVERSPEEIERLFIGRSLTYIMAYLENAAGRPCPDDFERSFRSRTFARFRTDIQPIPGIHELLQSLTLPFCVASSGPPNKIRLNLGLTGLADYFGDRIFSCYDLGKWKPDPAVFLAAAASMGYDPADCLIVEDSVAGVLGGAAAGARVVGLAQAHNEARLAEAGAITIRHLDELRAVLVGNEKSSTSMKR